MDCGITENEFDGETSDIEGAELRESEIEGEAAEDQVSFAECSEQHVAQKPPKKTKLKKRRKK